MVKKLKTLEFKAVITDIVLITLGSFIYAIGANAILAHHEFITGGLYGAAMLTARITGTLTPGLWYLIINIPLLYVSWKTFSRRFFMYTTYGIFIQTFFLEILKLNYPIQDQLYAAIASGVITGIGCGVILRSRGSGGGLDVVALFLLRKWNLGVGKFYLIFNTALFAFLAARYTPDILISSIILSFTSSILIEQVLTLSNSRKIVYILSEHYERIVKVITLEMKMGATLINVRGAYSGHDKQMVMTITNNLQMKKLEDVVFSEDPDALFIAENSFNVIGSSFGKRKMY